MRSNILYHFATAQYKEIIYNIYYNETKGKNFKSKIEIK